MPLKIHFIGMQREACGAQANADESEAFAECKAWYMSELVKSASTAQRHDAPEKWIFHYPACSAAISVASTAS